MSLGENIKRRRIELGLSQQELANALGYKTRSSIAKIEKNENSISEDKLSTLANTLQTSITYLITGQNDTKHGSGMTASTVISKSDISSLNYTGSTDRKCIAVILAGGTNHLNKYNIPYQFVSVKEKPVILYTMEAMQRHPQVDRIHVVCLSGWEDQVKAYSEKFEITKLGEIIPDGKTGVESVKNAVEWLSPLYNPADIMMIQEATRPFIDPETISNAIRCCKQYGSAVVFERLNWTTPFLVDESNQNMTHLDARRVINVQSPELFSFGLLRKAFTDALITGHKFDETICSVFLHNMGYDLKFCEGRKNNLRIVNEEDLSLLSSLK